MNSIIRKFILSLIFKNKIVYAHYAVTHRCDLSCSMCNNNFKQKNYDELNIEQIKMLSKKLKDNGVKFISLGGGEPFLRDDIVEIVKVFAKQGIRVQILTNILNVDYNKLEQINKIKNFNALSISCHSVSKKSSLLIYNDEKIFYKILTNIKNVISLVGNKKILLNTLISPLNIDDVYEIYEFSKRNKLKISFLPIESNDVQTFQFIKEDYKKIDELYSFLKKECKKNKYIFNSSKFLEMSNNYQKGIMYKNYCHAGKLYVSINPNGNIAPCHKYHDAFINDINNIKQKDKNCCSCMRPCWIEISNFFTDNNSFTERLKKYI